LKLRGPWPAAAKLGFTRSRRPPRAEVRLSEAGEPVPAELLCRIDRVWCGASRPGKALVSGRALQGCKAAEWKKTLVIAGAHAAGFLPLHASAVRGRNGVAVFLGTSGAGKTTISTRLLTDYDLVDDETVVAAPARQGAVIFGSRLLLPERRPTTPDELPLAALIVLRQAPRCLLTPLPKARVFPLLLEGRSPAGRVRLSEQARLATRLLAAVPCFRLDFNLQVRRTVEALMPILG
jgi:hypothetical protein